MTVLSEPGEGESADTPTSAILRYEVRIDDTSQSVPAGEVVLVHEHRHGLDNRVEVWIRVADGETQTQTLRVFGTGQPIPAEWRSIGSCVATDCNSVPEYSEPASRRAQVKNGAHWSCSQSER